VALFLEGRRTVPICVYELLGIDLQKGQWMWSRERAMQAVENYEKYLAEAQKQVSR
jgi:hypothetical protein